MGNDKLIGQWRAQLQKALRLKQDRVFFSALSLVGANLDDLHDFASDLREEGYSVRAVWLDTERFLQYIVFLPAQTRMHEAGTVKPDFACYEDPEHDSFADLRRIALADLAAERRRRKKI